MGCIDCKNAQISKEREYYVRVDEANILVFGCPEHVKRMVELLTEARMVELLTEAQK